MKKIFLTATLFLAFLLNNTIAQTVIKMTRKGGVSLIPCKVNGLSLFFIFDTGASEVSLSMTEAQFMIKNNYLEISDLGNPQSYQDANGNITEGITVNLKRIEIAGFTLENVKASITKSLNAPILLGQSAISKLGKIQIDLLENTLTILNGSGNFDYTSNNYSNLTQNIDYDYLEAPPTLDFSLISKYYLLNQVEKAKTIIDGFVSNPKNKYSAEMWLWKSTIDVEYFNNEKLSSKCTECLKTGYQAFFKYSQLEPRLKLISETPFNWKSLGIMYDKYYNMGRDFYKEKNWPAAFENFEKASYFSTIIMKKDIRKNGGSLDTLPILMSAYAAQNAQKVNEALHYYSIAADFKFGGETDLDMYKYLIYNYSELKDKANFEKYYAIAQEKYPKENFEDYRFDFIAKNFSIDEKLAFYDAEDAKGTLSATAYMSLGDMLVNLRKEEKEVVEKDPSKKMALQTKGREAFKKAYQKGNDVLASFNVGVLYYNEYNQLDEQRSENVKKMQEINSTKTVEKDPKKKAAADAKAKEQIDPLKKANVELESKILPAIDNGIEWLEKAYTALKDKAEKTKTEKTSFKNAVKFLGLFYELKRDKVKGKDPKAYENFEIKSKQYYEVYDKL